MQIISVTNYEDLFKSFNPIYSSVNIIAFVESSLSKMIILDDLE